MNPSIENKKTTNELLKKSALIPASNTLTEDEQLEQFAKLIIEIYFDQQYENEKIKQFPSGSA